MSMLLVPAVMLAALATAPAQAARRRTSSVWVARVLRPGRRRHEELRRAFEAGFTSSSTYPTVILSCFNAGDGLIYAESHGMYPGAWYYGEPFEFGTGSTGWRSAAADCTLEVGSQTRRGIWRQDAVISFHVDA